MLIFNPGHREVIVISVAFTIFYFLFHFEVVDSLIRYLVKGFTRIKQETSGFFHRGLGVLLLGIFPGLCARLLLKKPLAAYGFTFSFPPVMLLFAAGLGILLFPILFLYSKSPEAVRNAPQARPEKWDAGLWIMNVISVFFYIIAYELCLRGYVLFSLQRSMGDWPAVLVMTSLYTAIHLPQGMGESAGSTVMGVIFGVFSLLSGSIFIPALIHIYIFLTTDILAVLRH
jgi:membrane protease YdiL (CAAX protease family)